MKIDFKIKLKRNGGIPESELLDDLKTVSQKLGKRPFSMREYEKNGQFSRSVFKRRFGSWNNALKKTGLKILKRGNNTITNEDLFSNLANVWEKIGKQPSQSDLDSVFSQFHSGIYKNKFGTYNKALILFENWTQEEEISINKVNNLKNPVQKHKTKRNPNLRMRFNVMKRDNFKCQKCGRSPATDPTTILHIDHKKAWNNLGETEIENLETLCSLCNLGKSDLE